MESAQNFIPILFKVLCGFVAINMIINFILLAMKKKRMYKLLSIFWPSALIVFFLEAYFQEGDLSIILAYSATIVPMSICSMIGFEATGRKFPFWPYFLFYSAFYPLTILLNYLGLDFTSVAMPFAIATAAPLLHASFYLLITDYQKSSRLQKLLGVIYFIMAIHCINFAIFRMDPGAQLWGWLLAYALYDSLAILLPSIALEEINMTENERLHKLVEEKTFKLNSSLKENENLVKILIHDISNPLTVMKWYITMIKHSDEESEGIMDKVKKSQEAIENIVKQVKDLYAKKQPLLHPVTIEECLNDVTFIFAQSLEKKNVSLKFNNQLSPNTKVIANRTSFTHSVLSNLVSNGLKFSSPDSEIEVTAKEESNNIILEIRDNGPGLSQEVIDRLMNNEVVISSIGTSGEVGSGFGLSIVKSYVESFGGQIEFESKYFPHSPINHGTNVRITLDRAPRADI